MRSKSKLKVRIGNGGVDLKTKLTTGLLLVIVIAFIITMYLVTKAHGGELNGVWVEDENHNIIQRFESDVYTITEEEVVTVRVFHYMLYSDLVVKNEAGEVFKFKSREKVDELGLQNCCKKGIIYRMVTAKIYVDDEWHIVERVLCDIWTPENSMNPPDGYTNPFPRRKKKQSGNEQTFKVAKRGGGPVVWDPPPTGWKVEDVPFGKTIWERRKHNKDWEENEWEKDAVHAYNTYTTPEYERNRPQPRWIEWEDTREPYYGDEHATWPGYSQYPGERKRGWEDAPYLSSNGAPYLYHSKLRAYKSDQHWWDKYQDDQQHYRGWAPIAWSNSQWTEVTWTTHTWAWRWHYDRLR